jgi:anti-sigma28 factor (negative regulator of flagellin synthesis)
MENDGRSLWFLLNSRIQQSDVQWRAESGLESDRIFLDSEQSDSSSRDIDFLHVKELMKTIPDVREGRITQVRSDIEGGTYNAIAEQIADKIIRGDLAAS